jgi:hypothetical protein
MSKELFYRQCRLQKTQGEAIREQTSYIPEPFCAVGKALRLRDGEGEWDDGWVVVWAGERMPADWVERHARDYLKTRKFSDV